MFTKKALSTLIVSFVAASFASSAFAAAIAYSDRTSFESTITNKVVDDFDSPSYGFINSNATMKALSAGSIGYESTGFDNWNLVIGGTLCWGCNGSGQMLLDSTTIGTANGVFGFGLDILANGGNPTYDAFVTFGNGSTQDFALPNGGSFFGLTSTDLIKLVQFGPANGGSSANGYFQMDNVTIGNAADGANRNSTNVPEPASLALFGLGLLGLGLARKRRA